MSTPQQRATRKLEIAAASVNGVLSAIKTQVTDTKDVLKAAMEEDYTAEQGIADFVALWINALAIPIAFLAHDVEDEG